ncbi:hypothetical protein GCM10027160_32580 [Streptomyces calidiresistens]|uniref:Integral membrane protein n=1 Tax=Streptomyces calidiresistens TaxID=1485586 RepID=A0A7W3XWV2_9ACTN|nr:hypothetical protein [Streptomyces calidiresistens]MBB0230122.1 hypothetical protein [Streptomyces calidiresistens]
MSDPTAPDGPDGSHEAPTPGGAAGTPPSGPRPRRIALAAALTLLQGAVIAVLGVVMLVLAFTGTPDNLLQALTGGVTVMVLSLFPLLAGRGLWLLRRWSRGPSVIVQLLALPTAWQLWAMGDIWQVSAPVVAVVALVVLGCLMNPLAAEALGAVPRDT